MPCLNVLNVVHVDRSGVLFFRDDDDVCCTQ